MLIAALLLSAAFPSFGAGLPALARGTQDDSARRIDELVKQLGADEFAVREKATEELRKIGKPAEGALRKALAGDDPEVRERVRAVLDSMAEKPKAPAPRRALPGFGFRGSSVTVQSVNGDSTYKIAPGDGSSPLTFHKDKAGAVKLEYVDEQGASKTAEAESIPKFLADHKEIAARYGVTEEGIDYGGARVSFKGGLPGLPRGFRVPKFPLPPAFEAEDERGTFRAAGASFEKVTEALRAQLDLPEGQGLVVVQLDEGGAAESAGLRKSDILLEIDGKKVASIRDVRENLKGAKSTAVLRRGKRETPTPTAPRKDF